MNKLMLLITLVTLSLQSGLPKVLVLNYLPLIPNRNHKVAARCAQSTANQIIEN